VGLTLIMTVTLNIFIPLLLQFYSIAMLKYRAYSDRNFTNDQRMTAQVLQEDYEAIYVGPEFLMELRYG
jgi:hypothetical protein